MTQHSVRSQTLILAEAVCSHLKSIKASINVSTLNTTDIKPTPKFLYVPGFILSPMIVWFNHPPNHWKLWKSNPRHEVPTRSSQQSYRLKPNFKSPGAGFGNIC